MDPGRSNIRLFSAAGTKVECFGMLLAYAFSQGWLPDVVLRYG
jgi:hypothetical protein